MQQAPNAPCQLSDAAAASSRRALHRERGRDSPALRVRSALTVRPRFLACLLAFGALHAPVCAVAQEQTTSAERRAGPPKAPVSTKATWYGWQILCAGAGATSLALLTLPTNQGAFVFIGQGAMAVSSLVIHLENGEPARAAGGFLLEVAAPFGAAGLGALIGSNVKRPSSEPDTSTYVLEGIAAGYVAGVSVALLTDAFALAWKHDKGAWSMEPAAYGGRDRAWIGVRGSF